MAMGKKLLILSFLTFFLSFACHAATGFINQTSASFEIDLASTDFPTIMQNATWTSGIGSAARDASHYYDSQILCSVGFGNLPASGEDVEISIELVSGEWSYVLNERFKRPFGIDVFARGEKSGASEPQTVNGYSLSLGNQREESNGTSLRIPAEVSQNYSSLWWDLCLVLDPFVNKSNDTATDFNGNVYYLLSADAFYSAILQVTISCGSESESYILHLYGYYNSANRDPSSVQSKLSITPVSTLDKVDLRSIYGSNIRYEIATYSFETTSLITDYYDREPSGTVSIFLSSAKDKDNAGEFIMRHVNSNGSVSYKDTNHNSFSYYAYLSSKKGDEIETIMYDGSDYFGSKATKNKYLVIEATHRLSNNTRQTNWYDYGSIWISIPDNQAVNGNRISAYDLASGKYISNIYIHVISNI